MQSQNKVTPFNQKNAVLDSFEFPEGEFRTNLLEIINDFSHNPDVVYLIKLKDLFVEHHANGSGSIDVNELAVNAILIEQEMLSHLKELGLEHVASAYLSNC